MEKQLDTLKEKGFEVFINKQLHTFSTQIVSGKELLAASGVNVNCHSIYQLLEQDDFELVREDQQIDLRQFGKEQFVTKESVTHKYTVNAEPEETDNVSLSPNEILQRAGKNPSLFYLILLEDHGAKRQLAYQSDDPIELKCKLLHFEIGEWLEMIDIEEQGKKCFPIKPARKYRIRIDQGYYFVNLPYVTAEEVINLAGKPNPEKWTVLKFMSNNPIPQKVKAGETVDLFQPCLLRFVLQPKEQTDGRATREGFLLNDEDTEYLDQRGLPWETTTHNSVHWVILDNYPIPAGYNVSHAKVALMIVDQYPIAQIDMAYFSPTLVKNSGTAIPNSFEQLIGEEKFQGWSRHRQPNEWVSGVDNIATHLTLVDNWLENDLKR